MDVRKVSSKAHSAARDVSYFALQRLTAFDGKDGLESPISSDVGRWHILPLISCVSSAVGDGTSSDNLLTLCAECLIVSSIDLCEVSMIWSKSLIIWLTKMSDLISL